MNVRLPVMSKNFSVRASCDGIHTITCTANAAATARANSGMPATSAVPWLPAQATRPPRARATTIATSDARVAEVMGVLSRGQR